MFITKKHLSRRTVLRGMGATVALPLPRRDGAGRRRRIARPPLPQEPARGDRDGARRRRQHLDGVAKHYWSPAKEGADFEFTPIAEAARAAIATTSRSSATPTSTTRPRPRCPKKAAITTAPPPCSSRPRPPKLTEGSDVRAGTSLDQLYAQQHGQDTPSRRSSCASRTSDRHRRLRLRLRLRLRRHRSAGRRRHAAADGARPARRVRAALRRRRHASAERRARQQVDRSILDGIVQESARLRRGLGAGDRAAPEQLPGGRARGRAADPQDRAVQRQRRAAALPEAPLGVPDSFAEHVKLMFDLQALAFMANITRVSSFKMGRDASNRASRTAASTSRSTRSRTTAEARHHRRVREAQRLPRQPRRAVPREAEEHARRRRQAARPHAGDLRQPDGRFEHPRTQALPAVPRRPHERQLKGNLHLSVPTARRWRTCWLTLAQKLGVEVERIGDSTGYVTGL